MWSFHNPMPWKITSKYLKCPPAQSLCPLLSVIIFIILSFRSYFILYLFPNVPFKNHLKENEKQTFGRKFKKKETSPNTKYLATLGDLPLILPAFLLSCFLSWFIYFKRDCSYWGMNKDVHTICLKCMKMENTAAL